MYWRLILSLLLLFPTFSEGETVEDREGAVRADKAKMESNDRWIYNDIDAGFAEAERTGKPLMVVMRCVPCLACMGLDSEVLIENRVLEPLMDQFVRVRLINANAIDLSLFQFDYDLSFSVMFFNADRTIYGRYGSWEHQRDSVYRATDTFQAALEGALKVHADFPANRDSLAGKTGTPSPHATPVDMPLMDEKYRSDLDWNGQVVQSCVHCHQVGDVIRREQRESGNQIDLRWILPYPSPDILGLDFEKEPITRIASVREGSVGERSGLQVGDVLVSMENQPLISIADISWVLHNSPDEGSISGTVLRSGASVEIDLALPDDWRKGADISRRVGTWPMRAMAFGGMKLEVVSDEARSSLGLSQDTLALEATHVGQYNKHALAKKRGFRKGDIIVEVDGSRSPLTESELLTDQIRNVRPGESTPVTVLRDGSERKLELPTQ